MKTIAVIFPAYLHFPKAPCDRELSRRGRPRGVHSLWGEGWWAGAPTATSTTAEAAALWGLDSMPMKSLRFIEWRMNGGQERSERASERGDTNNTGKRKEGVDERKDLNEEKSRKRKEEVQKIEERRKDDRREEGFEMKKKIEGSEREFSTPLCVDLHEEGEVLRTKRINDKR